MTNGDNGKGRQQALGAFCVAGIFGFGVMLIVADFMSVRASMGAWIATWMLSIPLFYRS